MKYLFIVLILCDLSTLFGQVSKPSLADTNMAETRDSWVISGGINLNDFEHYLFRMTYLKRLNEQFSLPFEAEVIVVSPDALIFGSASIRIHQNLFSKTNGFIQCGFSFILGGVESFAIIPIFNFGLGINYNSFSIEVRTLILNLNSLHNSIPLFFSIGIKL